MVRKNIIHSFPPLENPKARVLVLGSMPGAASLAANQYYAHPQNRFWMMMEDLLGIDKTAPYAKRVAALQKSHIALWDVLQSCTRTGSLDSAIRDELANDFEGFFKKHPRITHVFFNGQKAETAFKRHVMRHQKIPEELVLTRLPSTSPANASIKRAAKLRAWTAIRDVGSV